MHVREIERKWESERKKVRGRKHLLSLSKQPVSSKLGHFPYFGAFWAPKNLLTKDIFFFSIQLFLIWISFNSVRSLEKLPETAVILFLPWESSIHWVNCSPKGDGWCIIKRLGLALAEMCRMCEPIWGKSSCTEEFTVNSQLFKFYI